MTTCVVSRRLIAQALIRAYILTHTQCTHLNMRACVRAPTHPHTHKQTNLKCLFMDKNIHRETLPYVLNHMVTLLHVCVHMQTQHYKIQPTKFNVLINCLSLTNSISLKTIISNSMIHIFHCFLCQVHTLI